MKRIYKFNENISYTLELNNEIKHHLSQFPYLPYNIKDLDKGVEISFSKDIKDIDYIKGILDPYKLDILEKEPIKIKITGKKNVDKFDEFNGKKIVGNIESIDIPHFGIKNLKAKIDSGATTSSLHTNFIKIDRKNKEVIFTPLDNRYKQYKDKKYKFPLESEIRVQSSNGEEEVRPMIKIDIILKGEKIKAYFTLSDRKELEYPVLIGKDILSGNFLIDSAQMN